MVQGGVWTVECASSIRISQAYPQAAPSAGAPWYESLAIAENDLQNPAALWVVHRGF